MRALEDLIIEAFYDGILVGKLDQRQRQLQVDFAMGRDLQAKQRKETLDVLASWSRTTEQMLKVMDCKIENLKETVAKNEQHRRDYESKLNTLRDEITKSKSLETDQGTSRSLEEYCGHDPSESHERGRFKQRCVR